MQDDNLVELLEATGRSELKAFEALYAQASPKLYGLCLKLLSNEATAEDVLQEAFVQIWRESRRYDPRRASPMTWIASIVRHRAINELRKRARDHKREEALKFERDDGGFDTPLDQVMSTSQTHALALCLNELGSAQREAIMLAFFRGLSHAELSQALSVPLGSIKIPRAVVIRLSPTLTPFG